MNKAELIIHGILASTAFAFILFEAVLLIKKLRRS